MHANLDTGTSEIRELTADEINHVTGGTLWLQLLGNLFLEVVGWEDPVEADVPNLSEVL